MKETVMTTSEKKSAGPTSWAEARDVVCAGLVSTDALALRRGLDDLDPPETLPGPDGLRRIVCIDGPRRLRHVRREDLEAGGVGLCLLLGLFPQPVLDAVIWLEAPHAPRARTATPVLDQRNLEFVPRVLVVQVGTTVKFPNSDRVFHNVFSFRDGKKFDLGVYPVRAVKHVTFDKEGVSRLFCNIHPNMAAYVVAVDSPFFAASDADGAFTLRAPPGRYSYKAWRAGAALHEGRVVIDGVTPLTVGWP
jgi:plastocyanin